MWKIITEKSCLVVRTPDLTASPFFSEKYWLFQIVYFDETVKLTTNKTQPLKKYEKLPQYIDDNICSQMSSLCSPRKIVSFYFPSGP